jgi:hypothetical protein
MNAVACASNLTPNPFPSGKGNQIVRSISFLNWTLTLLILLPFPRGKGPGVRFLSRLRARQRSAALILKKGVRFLCLPTPGAA